MVPASLEVLQEPIATLMQRCQDLYDIRPNLQFALTLLLSDGSLLIEQEGTSGVRIAHDLQPAVESFGDKVMNGEIRLV